MAGEEKNTKSRDLLDTKFGTVDPASIQMVKGKNDAEYAKGKFVSVGGKEIDIYAHGKLADTLKEAAASGEPFLASGTLLAKGAGLSLSRVGAKEYEGKVLELGKSGENESGPWQAAKIQVEGKDRAWNVLLTGDDVAKAEVGADIKVDLVFTASQRDGRWSSSPISANSLTRRPEPEAAPEPSM